MFSWLPSFSFGTVTPQCYDEDVRLENTTYSVTAEGFDFVGGRVEVCQNGMYGAICDIGWNSRAAQATCDRAGYTDRGIYLPNP